MRQEPTPAAATPGHSGYVGPVPKTDADEWFEIYLPNHDYTPGDHEPDLTPVGIRSSPDFIPTSPSGEQIVWEAEPPLSRPQATYASAHVAAGVDPVYLSRQLGHKDPSVTLDIYADLFEAREKAEESRNRLEASGYKGLV
jgi:hypothetical protein